MRLTPVTPGSATITVPIAWAVTLGLVLGTASSASGQSVPKSQHGAVTQAIGGTTVSLSYNRPVARGRALFGGLVPYGRPWCPGADSATTITFSRDVRIAGQPLAGGTYSVWAIPGPEEWTMIFSRAAHVFHVPYPSGRDALRVKLKPGSGTHMETLAFYFPVVEPDSGVLNLHWGTTVVPIPIEVGTH